MKGLLKLLKEYDYLNVSDICLLDEHKCPPPSPINSFNHPSKGNWIRDIIINLCLHMFGLSIGLFVSNKLQSSPTSKCKIFVGPHMITRKCYNRSKKFQLLKNFRNLRIKNKNLRRNKKYRSVTLNSLNYSQKRGAWSSVEA